MQNNVVPANDNDAFNDNKCPFCWGAYDDEHPGVRILACDHVFGRDCLTEMVNAPNGDYCPICRTPLFRPSLNWLSFMFRLWTNAQKVYCYADVLITQFTNLRARNPGLNIEFAKDLHWFLQGLIWLLLYRGPIDDTVVVVDLVMNSIVVVVLLSVTGVHGKLNNWRDRLLFAGIMLVALMVHFLVIVFTFLSILYIFQDTIRQPGALHTGKNLA